MFYVELEILCKNDKRTEEDLQFEDQIDKLSLRVKPEQEAELKAKISREWRPSMINVHHIEGFYPDQEGQCTILQMTSGASLTTNLHYTDLKNLIESRGQYPH
jgi:hypothetical protein